MSTQIKTRRGTAAEHTTFTGAEGELTVNTTNDSVHVHDGSTAGGHELAKADGSNLAMQSDLTFGDNDKAVFGAGSDLKIYHDGSNSYITDAGTGSLILEGSSSAQIKGSTFVILRSSEGENLAVGNANGSFDLYYDNSKKLATTSTGIDVTGTATMDGLTVDGSLGSISTSATGNHLDFSRNGINYIRSTGASGETFFTTGSSNLTRAYISSIGDVAFMEDTGTTAKFFWDASAESLGIGTSAPSGTLNVKPVDSGTNQIKLSPNGNATTDHSYTTEGGYLAHYQRQDGGTYRRHLDIAAVGDSSWGGVMKFSTNSDGSSTAVERMRIDSSGNLLVGQSSTISPGTGNTTVGTSILAGGAMYISRASGPVIAANSNADGDIIKLYKSGTTVGSIGSVSTDSDATSDLYIGGDNTGIRLGYGADISAVVPCLQTTGGLRDTVTSLGASGARFKDLYLSGGVYLGGTGSANYLDDYEEGTFTPVFKDGSAGTAATSYTQQYGKYTKVGNVVTFHIFLRDVNTTGLTSGNTVFITGLPFTASSTTNSDANTIACINAGTPTTGCVTLNISNGVSYGKLINQTTTGQAGFTVSQATSSAFDVFIQGTYHTA